MKCDFIDRFLELGATEFKQAISQKDQAEHISTCQVCAKAVKSRLTIDGALAGLSPDPATMARIKTNLQGELAKSPRLQQPRRTSFFSPAAIIALVLLALAALGLIISGLLTNSRESGTVSPQPAVHAPDPASASPIIAASPARPPAPHGLAAPESFASSILVQGMLNLDNPTTAASSHPVPISRGFKLGDSLFTGPASAFHMEFPAGFRVAIAGSAGIKEFLENGFELETASAVFSFERNESSDSPLKKNGSGEILVKTPLSRIIITGTVLAIRISKNSEMIRVIKGKIRTMDSARGNWTTLETGQFIEMSASGAGKIHRKTSERFPEDSSRIPESLPGSGTVGVPSSSTHQLGRLDDGF